MYTSSYFQVIPTIAAIMDMILMEMSKVWKVADEHTDEGPTMVNRPQFKLTSEDFQNGCYGGHRGYRNKMV